MTTMVRSYATDSSRKGIERAIEELYAAGLELQAAESNRDVPAYTRALMPECVRRIAALIDDLRITATAPWSRPE
ncbi:MAG TPA: hypothetical protein VIK11_01425 [Tepidiformaceae bacterium]